MKTHVNLLPWSYQRAKMLRLRLVQWSVLSFVCVSVLAACWWTKRKEVAAELAVLRARETRFAPLESLQAETLRIAAEIQGLEARSLLLGGLEDRHPALTLLGMISDSVRQCGGNVTVEQLRVSPISSSAELVTLKGVGTDNLSVARFVVALRATGGFDRVELKSSLKEALGEREIAGYIVECEF